MHGRPTIHVFRHEGRYVARFSASDVRQTFEQDTLPTAYSADADPLVVLQSVARDNPQADVSLAPAPPATLRHDGPAARGIAG